MKKIVLAFLITCATPAAWGQFAEIWFNGGESLFTNNGLGADPNLIVGGTKNDVRLGDGFRFSFRFDFNGDGLLGHEIQYAYSRTEIQDDVIGYRQGMAVHFGGYNVLLHANHEGNRVRPFVTGGINFANYVPPGSSAYSGGGDNKFGFNYGGGVKLRVKGPWALRLDVRQYTTPKPFDLALKSGWLRINEISGGIGFMF